MSDAPLRRALAAASPVRPEPVAPWLVVKEHAYDPGDGGRPVLAYLWPADFPAFRTEQQALDFIQKDGGMALGWVAKCATLTGEKGTK